MDFVEIETLLKNEPQLKLQLHAGEQGLKRRIQTGDVNRPGLALAGYFQHFATDRIQLIGKGEFAYIKEFLNDNNSSHPIFKSLEKFFSYEIPAIVFTHGNQPPELMIEIASRTQTPLISTPLSTHDFITNYSDIINLALAPMETIHGVMVEVFGVGLILLGESGIGKSETALELVERGHRLIADDVVEVRRIDSSTLRGAPNETIRHLMEIRGLGIINIKDLFGQGAIRTDARVELTIYLEEWKQYKEVERIGLIDETVSILDVELPRLVIPIRPGRNVPVLVETAAMNHRSKKMGYHAARELSEKVNQKIQSRKEVSDG